MCQTDSLGNKKCSPLAHYESYHKLNNFQHLHHEWELGLKPRAEATEARQGPTYMVSGPNRTGDKIRS